MNKNDDDIIVYIDGKPLKGKGKTIFFKCYAWLLLMIMNVNTQQI